MKTLKSILVLSLCILAVGSCKKDNDWGGNDMNDIPTGKVAFDSLGIRAFFPEGKWGKEGNNDYLNIPDYEMECIFTYLKDSKIDEDTKQYSVHISFFRLISFFENESKANDKIEEFKYIYEGFTDWTVSEIIPTEVNSYPASKIERESVDGLVEESYFIYHKNKLYRIVLVIPKDKMDKYYRECTEIINTLKITD